MNLFLNLGVILNLITAILASYNEHYDKAGFFMVVSCFLLLTLIERRIK